MVTRLHRHITAGDLDDLPHEWDTRYELIGGVLYMSRRPSFDHQRILKRLLVTLATAVERAGGEVVPEPGVVWEDEGEDNVSPDLAIVFGKMPAKGSKLRRCPEVCVEVLSSGDENRKRDLEVKRDLYFRRGAREYWIVDPDTSSILRLTRGKRAWLKRPLGPDDYLQTPLLPDWKGLRVRDLF